MFGALSSAGSGSGGAGSSTEHETQQQDLQEAQEREYQLQMEQLRQQCVHALYRRSNPPRHTRMIPTLVA